jgi:uncharacterized protein YegP (UPF0339 family)
VIEYWNTGKKWYFHRKARNGKITDPSQGYASVSNVRRAIRSRWGPGVAMRRIEH